MLLQVDTFMQELRDTEQLASDMMAAPEEMADAPEDEAANLQYLVSAAAAGWSG